ncbi:hypothetical protein [Pseudoalteromonas lipolytica]|uniref:hypothetical protein n=1 Tax=Pseudoalteromonas lipolytica TaxID=570156 RepID=UPI00309C7D1F
MSPHGKLEAIWVGGTLIVNVEEPLNVEALLKYSTEIEKAIKARRATNWKRYVSFSPCALGGPDVVSLTKKINQWCFENGYIACAIHITSAPQRFLYGSSELNCQFFTDDELALNWLLTQKV